MTTRHTIICFSKNSHYFLQPSQLIKNIFSLHFLQETIIGSSTIIRIDKNSISFIIIDSLFINFINLLFYLQYTTGPTFPRLAFSYLKRNIAKLIAGIQTIHLSDCDLVALIPYRGISILYNFTITIIFQFQNLFFLSCQIGDLSHIHVSHFFFTSSNNKQEN